MCRITGCTHSWVINWVNVYLNSQILLASCWIISVFARTSTIEPSKLSNWLLGFSCVREFLVFKFFLLPYLRLFIHGFSRFYALFDFMILWKGLLSLLCLSQRHWHFRLIVQMRRWRNSVCQARQRPTIYSPGQAPIAPAAWNSFVQISSVFLLAAVCADWNAGGFQLPSREQNFVWTD